MDRAAWHEAPDRRVIRRAFSIAAENEERCRPVHLLAALAELDGPISDALSPPGGGPLLARRVDPPPFRGGGSHYLMAQTQQAAQGLASRRGETPRPEHLLVAVIDQADPEVLDLLTRVGLEVGALRVAALALLGAPADSPPAPMPPLTPAGTLDRPPLRVYELDPRAWAGLGWRQDHLPLRRLRRRSHYEALRVLESRAAWQFASKLGLDDDQRYSLSRHHLDRVERRAAQARPDLVERRASRPRGPVGSAVPTQRRRRRPRRPLWLNFTVGWGTWLSNRQVGARDRWFRLRTLGCYRGAPQP
ncbi:MAG: hypothetical protein ACYDEN_04475 [Acidimicrobiales bacterium]